MGTLDRDVVVVRGSDGSLAVRQSGGKYGLVDPAELLRPDYETEISKAFALELSREDAETLREELEELGWNVGDARDRRRNDLLAEMAAIDAAAAATGKECVSTARFVDEESGEAIADAVVARDPDGSLRLLDMIGYATLDAEEGFFVLLPHGTDERVASGLAESGYALPQPRMTLKLESGAEITCKPPHLRDNVGTGAYAVMSARDAMLSVLREYGPLACFEMSAITGKRHRTLSGRIADLQYEGLIRSTGETRRCTVTGGAQNVYGLGCDASRVGVRHTDRAPSEVRSYTGAGQAGRVVAFLASLGEGGATTSEITVALGGAASGVVEHAVSATTSNLLKQGVIRIAGSRSSVLTGRQQRVFTVQ